MFEGIRGRGYRGDIAIDDTLVKNGPCPPPGSCDFEKGLCAYQNELVDDNFDWERNSGHTGSIGTGPSTDHTTGTSRGKNSFLNISSSKCSFQLTLCPRGIGVISHPCLH